MHQRQVNSNKILSLELDDGSRCFEVKDIQQASVSHFVKLFEEPGGPHQATTPLHSVHKSISADAATDLVRPVTCEEVRTMIFNMNPNKAPRPDGFTALFYQKSWNTVGNDVVLAVQSFFRNGRLLKEVNTTSLTQVPKINNPSKLSDFRPISCCNILYKCISGILANRLKTVLPQIIDPVQTAFILGRHISDNILIAHELFRNYNTSSAPPRCAFKIDFFKAFDTVRWFFLTNLL